MNNIKFINLPSRDKKKIVKSAVRGANKDQKEMVDSYLRGENKIDSRRHRVHPRTDALST